MEKAKWTYQQYDRETGTFYPVPESPEEAPAEVTVFGVPDGYDRPIMEMFRRRDARRARCRVVSFQ